MTRNHIFIGVVNLDRMAANRAAGTWKDLKSMAEVAREEGEDFMAVEYEEAAAKVLKEWENTRFNIEQIAKGI